MTEVTDGASILRTHVAELEQTETIDRDTAKDMHDRITELQEDIEQAYENSASQ